MSTTHMIYNELCIELDTHLDTLQYLINSPQITLQRLYILRKINKSIITDIDTEIYSTLLQWKQHSTQEKQVLNYLLYKFNINNIASSIIETQINRLTHNLPTHYDYMDQNIQFYEEYKKIYKSNNDSLYNMLISTKYLK